MMNLHALTMERQKAVEQLLEKYDREDEIFIDTLEAVDVDLEDKLMAYRYAIEEEQALLKGLEEALDRMKARIVRKKNNIDRMKKVVLDAMQLCKKDKVSDGILSFAIRGARKVVIVEDENKIPPDYLVTKTTVSVSKSKLYDDLIAGKVIDGAKLGDGIRLALK